MKNLTYNTQKSKDFWIDENGIKVPYKRTTKAERLTERKAAKLIKKALKLNEQLSAFKREIFSDSAEVFDALMKELDTQVKKTKGNFTWYNFDRSIKVMVDVHEPIEFDEGIIAAAKAKFDEFLEQNISSKNAFAKELILSAFETRKGRLDVKKILSLTRYEDKVNDPLFTEAVRLINRAIRRRPTKKYVKIYARDKSGQYVPVELNFSNVKL